MAGVSAGRGRLRTGAGIRRAATAIGPAGRDTTSAISACQRWPQALWHRHDHHDEDGADDQLPDERQAAAEIGADEVDQHGGDRRPDQGAAPTQRHPDDQFGAELEVAEIRRDDIDCMPRKRSPRAMRPWRKRPAGRPSRRRPGCRNRRSAVSFSRIETRGARYRSARRSSRAR